MKKDSFFYMALPTKSKQKNMCLYTMKSDTSQHWTTKDLRNMINFKSFISFYSAVNSGYSDTAQTNKQLRTAFGTNFIDSLTTREKYFTKAEKLNYNYNIDRIKLLYGDLIYEKINILNEDTVNLSYKLILKDIKAMYFQNISADKKISIDKIKDKNSYLIAFKYDILKKIVQYEIIDISTKNEITLKLKTVSAKQYKADIDKLWN